MLKLTRLLPHKNNSVRLLNAELTISDRQNRQNRQSNTYFCQSKLHMQYPQTLLPDVISLWHNDIIITQMNLHTKRWLSGVICNTGYIQYNSLISTDLIGQLVIENHSAVE